MKRMSWNYTRVDFPKPETYRCAAENDGETEDTTDMMK